MTYHEVPSRGPKSMWLVAASAVAIVAFAVSSQLGERGQATLITESSWVSFPTMREAVASQDAVLAITVTSKPERYEDFGADGRPDFPGQLPERAELVKATVTSVIRGDSELAGTAILVAQPAGDALSDPERQIDRMLLGSQVVIIASQRKMNPSVAAGAMAWVPLPLGQGVFDDLGDETVSRRRGSSAYRNDPEMKDRMPRSVFTR